MFKNKILVKATGSSSSSSSSPPLFLLPLSLHSSSSSPSSSSPPPESESDPSLSIQLEALCWKLSRRWGLACLPQPSQILLLYRKSQLDSVDRVVSEFIKLDPAINVGTEEEVKSGALNAKAIEFGLKCLMLDHKWSCIRDSVFVESNFDSNQERTNLCALNVEVQCGACDEFVFVVSPDTLRFNRHKISDLINSQNMEILEKNKEVNFESYDYSTACTTLPFLYEGYIRGLSKVLPEGESFDLIQDLWSIKHGLNLQSIYFIAVQNSNGSCINKQWLPCSYVIQGSGLSAAPKSIRESKAKSAYQSFIKILQAWDFFGDGPLIVTEQSVIGNVSILPAWEKAATTNHVPPPGVSLQTHDDSIFNHLLSSLDFRASKPDLGFTNIMSKDNSITVSDCDSKDHAKNNNNNNNNTPAKESILPVKEKEQVRLLVPSFSKNKRTNAPKSTGQTKSKETNNVANHEKMNEFLVITSTCNSSDCPAPTAKVVDQPSKNMLMPSFSKNKRTNTQKEKIQPKAPVKKIQNPKITVKTDAPAPVKNNQNQNPNNKIIEESSVQVGPPKPKPKPKPKEKEKAKPSDNKERSNISLDSNCSDITTTVQLQDGGVSVPVPVKKNANQNRKKNKSEESGAPKTTNARQPLDKDEVNTKVINCHKRGQLQSLTVSDLRCFLSSKKAKVSGPKEELIRRATAFLD